MSMISWFKVRVRLILIFFIFLGFQSAQIKAADADAIETDDRINPGFKDFKPETKLTELSTQTEWVIKKHLGSGQSGHVFLVTNGEKSFALKWNKGHATDDPKSWNIAYQRLLDVGYLSKEKRDYARTKLIEFQEFRGKMYLMPLIKGSTFRSLRDKAIDAKDEKALNEIAEIVQLSVEDLKSGKRISLFHQYGIYMKDDNHDNFVINTDEKIVYPIDLDYVKIVDIGTRLYRDSSYEWYAKSCEIKFAQNDKDSKPDGVRISRCTVSKEALDEALDLLEKHPTLERFGLFNNFLSDNEVHDLVEKMSSRSNLTALRLSMNTINKSGALAIARLLKRSLTLKILELPGNQINDTNGKVIFEALQENESVTIFTLNTNQFSEGFISEMKAYAAKRNLDLKI